MIELKPLKIDVTGWLEATWVEDETQIYYQSYHPVQIDMLRDKAAEYGTPLNEYEPTLSEWVASYVPPVPEPLTPEQLQARVVQATQQRLDDFARTRNYDGILSACTYATSTVPKFASEGQHAVEVRDSTWKKLYEILDEVQSGERPIPAGFADIEPELPILEWPV